MEKVALKNIVEINKGKQHTSVFSTNGSGKKRYIQIDDLRNDLNLKYTDQSGVEVFQNDLIIAWDGANAGTIGFNLSGYIGSTLARLRITKNNFDSKFLGWYLRNKSKDLRQNCTGATIPHISKAYLESIEIPQIDLSTQKQIAQLLEEADIARQKRKAATALTDQFLQSTFVSMFGDPIKNEKGWDIQPISKLLEFITSGSRGWAKYYNATGDIFLRINNVGYSELRLSDVIYVNSPESAEARRTEVKENDLLFSITADLGRTAVVPKEFPRAFINQHLALLRLKLSLVNPYFASYFFSNGSGRSQIINKGGVKLGLNFDDIKNLKIYLPPLSLQQKFVSIVADTEQIRQKQKQSEIELENLFQALLQKYFG